MPRMGPVDLLAGLVGPVDLVGLVGLVGLLDLALVDSANLPSILGVGNLLMVLLGLSVSVVVVGSVRLSVPALYIRVT